MNILNLPNEILFIILKDVDIKTLFYVYRTCTRLREIVGLLHVKSCHVSLNTLASAKLLKHPFFTDICGYLKELSLCAVQDLTKTLICQVAKKLKSLKTLDVSYTSIVLPDLFDFYKVCPTIKNVSVNFAFGKHCVDKDMYCRCKSFFKNLDDITLVGSVRNLLYSKLSLYLLREATMNSINFVLIDTDDCHLPGVLVCNGSVGVGVKFNRFVITMVVSRNYSELCTPCCLRFVKCFLKIMDLECIVIKSVDFTPQVYVTDVFKGFFLGNFNVKELPIEELLTDDTPCDAVFMMFNKTTTSFDSKLFSKLITEVKDLLPVVHESANIEVQDNMLRDWHVIPVWTVAETPDVREPTTEPCFKKRRKASSVRVLSYFDAFKNYTNLKLNLNFNKLAIPVSLAKKSDTLGKLTYLSLSGRAAYSQDFFSILFENCTNLYTINVDDSPVPTVILLAKALQFSSVKNLRIVNKTINFQSLFHYLSQCKKLENVHLHDLSKVTCTINGVELMIRQCHKLYCLYIEASISDNMVKKITTHVNKVKAECKKTHIYIEVQSYDADRIGAAFCPFKAVFKLTPVKPIHL